MVEKERLELSRFRSEKALWRPNFVNWGAHVNSETSRDSVVLAGLDGGKSMVWHDARSVQDATEKTTRGRKPRKTRGETQKGRCGCIGLWR